MLSASCHCGAVRLEIPRQPENLTECNCSICRRYAARWAYFSQDDVRVVSEPDAIDTYSWGDESIEFCWCRKCGCMTHYESVKKGPEGRLAVNARMMEPADVAAIPVRKFDGAVTWKIIDE